MRSPLLTKSIVTNQQYLNPSQTERSHTVQGIPTLPLPIMPEIDKIKIINANINELIGQFGSNPSVAFDHCILEVKGT